MNDNEKPDRGELADIDTGYPTRGRPRLPAERRRREKLVISLTSSEKRRVMVAAARDGSGPLGPQEWARKELLRLAPPVDESRGPDDE